MRIVSLVPSLTEYLFNIGLGEHLVGVTKFCVHPLQAKQSATLIGGTKNIRVSDIEALQPDIVIASKEENVKEQVEALFGFTEVFITDIENLHDAHTALDILAWRLGKGETAAPLLDSIFQMAANPLPALHKSAVYLIWKNPYMTIGTDTYIHAMLEWAGFTNCISETRYPIIEESTIAALQPDFIFLSSEPYPFKTEHINALQSLCPNSKVQLVDGEMFSWYGSRIIEAQSYLKEMHAMCRQNVYSKL